MSKIYFFFNLKEQKTTANKIASSFGIALK